MNKVFGYAVTKSGQELAVAITDRGDTVVVVPSSPEQAAHKLGMEGGSTEYHSRYRDYFQGEEFVTEFVDSRAIASHVGIQIALAKERKRYDDEFEKVRIRLATKHPDDAERMRRRSGVPTMKTINPE